MVRRPTLGDFELEDVLGAGSFATVWSATDTRLDRRVAIKILADNWAENADVRRRFLAEARILVTAESPRLVRGFAAGETDDGVPYLVMALADRGTLGERMQSRRLEARPFSVHEACSIGEQLADAVADVHSLGHLHRDVKPRNVLLTTAPLGRERQPTPGLEPDERLVLGDFGFVRGLDASALTLVGGSPGFVAPEQASGLVHIDERADVYSVGVVVLTLLIGELPALPTTMAQAANAELDAAGLLSKARPDVDVESIRAVCQLLAVRPQDRPANAAAAAEVLKDAAARTLHVEAPGHRPTAAHREQVAEPISSAPPESATVVPTIIRAPRVRPEPRPAHSVGTTSPEIAEQSAGGNRRSLVAGVIGVALIGAVVLVALLVGGVFGDSDDGADPSSSLASPASSTTQAEAVGQPAASTAAPEATVAPTTVAPTTVPPIPGSGDPTTVGFPLPSGAVIDSDDAFRTIADVALAPTEVIAFYTALEPAWTVGGEPVEADGRLVFDVSGPDVVASVSVAATAQSTGSDITNIVIRYAG